MTSNNSLYFLGAAVVGIVSAAGIFIAEHFRQERRRHAMAQGLARLDLQLAGMRKELEQLRSLQKENFYFQYSVNNGRSKWITDTNLCSELQPDLTYRVFIRNAVRVRKVKQHSGPRIRGSPSVASDDYTSALDIDSSDLEFYDLSDEETSNTFTPLDQVIGELDKKLDVPDINTVQIALNRLTDLCLEYPGNPELLWRIGKAHHKIASFNTDPIIKQDIIEKGLNACRSALDLNSDIAQAHKWFAILIGSRSSFQPIKEKIGDGFLFKQHLDAALALNPTDGSLQHMLGRFAFETASLKWYERKVAKTFFADPPSATFDEALRHFLEAEQLTEHDWKENKLYIAKTQIALGKYEDAVTTLVKADAINDNSLDTTVDAEITMLLQKYNSYR